MANNLQNKINILKNKNLTKDFEVDFLDIKKYLNKAIKDLKVAEKNIQIDKDTACILLYQSMLEAGRSLMFAYHLRPIDGGQHKTVIDFCAWVMGEKFKHLLNSFDELRKKRNKFIYDVTETEISDSELNYYFSQAKKFIKLIRDIIKTRNPQKEMV